MISGSYFASSIMSHYLFTGLKCKDRVKGLVSTSIVPDSSISINPGASHATRIRRTDIYGFLAYLPCWVAVDVGKFDKIKFKVINPVV